MKIVKTLVAVVVCMMFATTANAQNRYFNAAQEKAQRSLYFYLDKEKFNPEVDTSDNSVCFRKDSIFYWVTFSEADPVLYTLHRKGFKVGDGDDNYKKLPAIIAANEINMKYAGLKITVSDTKVDIAMDAYATNPQDYNNTFKSFFGIFKNIGKEFKAAYKKAAESVENEQAQTLKEITEMLPPSELRDVIQNVSFRMVGENNEPMSDYDRPLRVYGAKGIQYLIEFKPWNNAPKECNLYVRIIGPNKKPIYLTGKKNSGVLKVEFEKSKKPLMIEAGYGLKGDGTWKAGEYQFEILDGYDVIYKTTFNLL